MDEKQLSLYKIYSDDHQKYNTLIWQFPSVIIGLNFLAISNLSPSWWIFLVLWIINNVMLLFLAKHIFHQRCITNAMAEIESKLKKLNLIVPNFTKVGFYKILKIKISWMLIYFLFVLNLINLVLFIQLILRNAQ